MRGRGATLTDPSRLRLRLLTRTTRVVRVTEPGARYADDFRLILAQLVVTEHLQRHPEVVASCRFLDRVVNMLDEGADVGVRIGELPDSSMHATAVGRVRRVMCASPGYFAQHGVPRRPADLQSHTIISAAYRASRSGAKAPRWSRRARDGRLQGGQPLRQPRQLIHPRRIAPELGGGGEQLVPGRRVDRDALCRPTCTRLALGFAGHAHTVDAGLRR